MNKDYFKIMELEDTDLDKNNFDKSKLKKKYRELSKKYHPDNKQTGDAEKFKEINEAYEVLSDDNKRYNYMMYGDPSGQSQQQNSGWTNISREQMEEIIKKARREAGFDFDDDDLRGFNTNNRKRNTGPTKGQNLRINLNVKLTELINDINKSITYKRNKKCEYCNGTGSKTGQKTFCPKCNGNGIEINTFRKGNTIFQQQTTCSQCMGTGEYINQEDRCEQCFGRGYTTIEEHINIEIEKGNLNNIIIPGKGNDSLNGGNPGDIIVSINITNDSDFILQDRVGTLGKIIELGYASMVLGTKLKMKNIRGEEFEYNIPENAEDRNIYRVRGQGLNSNSDLLIQVILKPNNKITEKEKEILKQLREVEKC